MSFDGMLTYGLANELREQLESGKITKIHQPGAREIILLLRVRGKNLKLFISANPTYPRIHLTNKHFDNPEQAPMFCMVLRKHIEGGIIERIAQVDLERIIHIDILSRNELGDLERKRLVIEIMGRHSNIILVNPIQSMIIDSIHHVGSSINQYRVVLPGKEYIHPPVQNKEHSFSVGQDTFIKKLDFNAGRLHEQLVQQFSGISPLLANEIIFRAGLPNRENLYASFHQLIQQIRQRDFTPTLTRTENKEYFYLFPILHLNGSHQHYPTISQLLEAYFHDKAERDLVRQRTLDLTRLLAREKQKNEKKIDKLKKTLVQTEQKETFKLYGELLTAYLHQIKLGDKEVTLINYYDEQGATVTIPLDPELTPSENAQHYFKKYTKAKNSIQVVKEQIKLAQEEINYLETLLQQLEVASPRDIDEIREELIEGKYIRDRSKQRKRKPRQTKPQPEVYYSSEGIEIMVGKNNKQNEYISTRLGRANETWLHTKDIPGAHVLIRATQFNEQTLLEAAQLAAYFSKARHSSQVPVDYTLIRHVKKPNGAKLGFVIYEKQQTIFVTPSEEAIQSLRKK